MASPNRVETQSVVLLGAGAPVAVSVPANEAASGAASEAASKAMAASVLAAGGARAATATSPGAPAPMQSESEKMLAPDSSVDDDADIFARFVGFVARLPPAGANRTAQWSAKLADAGDKIARLTAQRDDVAAELVRVRAEFDVERQRFTEASDAQLALVTLQRDAVAAELERTRSEFKIERKAEADRADEQVARADESADRDRVRFDKERRLLMDRTSKAEVALGETKAKAKLAVAHLQAVGTMVISAYQSGHTIHIDGVDYTEEHRHRRAYSDERGDDDDERDCNTLCGRRKEFVDANDPYSIQLAVGYGILPARRRLV